LARVRPRCAQCKTYRPQSEWIRAQSGDESRCGMVDAAGGARRGGFSYYTGTAVDLLEGPDEAADYLRKYPNTIVLVRSTQFERDFLTGSDDSDLRLLSDVRVGRHLYKVLKAPEDPTE